MGLFGTDRSGADYGNAKNLYGQIGGAANQFGGLYTQNMNAYNRYNPQYQQAVDSYGDLLSQNPYTDQRTTQLLANATQGMDADYARANANLQAQDAQRGFSGSSNLSGGLSSLQAAQLGQMAQARNNLAMNAYQQNLQNAATRANLYGGVAGQYYGQGTNALGQQTDINQNLANAWTNLGNIEHSQYQQNIGNVLGGVQSLANVAGTIYGMGAYGGGGGLGGGGRGVTPGYGYGYDYDYSEPWASHGPRSGGPTTG